MSTLPVFVDRIEHIKTDNLRSLHDFIYGTQFPKSHSKATVEIRFSGTEDAIIQFLQTMYPLLESGKPLGSDE